MIRNISKEDAKDVKKICETVLGHDTTIEILKQRIEELGFNTAYYIKVYVNDTSGAVEGFIQAEKYDLLYGENGWNVISLAVSQEAQHKGIGKQLVLSLEEHALKNRDKFIRLNSRIERTEAHQFYEHIGYQCDKTQKRFIKYLLE